MKALAKNQNLTARILTKVMTDFGLDKALHIYNSLEDIKKQPGTPFRKWFNEHGKAGSTQARTPTTPTPGGAGGVAAAAGTPGSPSGAIKKNRSRKQPPATP
jgi:hypothetical protein